MVSGDSLFCLKSHCGVWGFAVLPEVLLWCLEIRCGVWGFTVLPGESLWCLEIRCVA